MSPILPRRQRHSHFSLTLRALLGDVHAYRRTLGSISRDQASMPPAREATMAWPSCSTGAGRRRKDQGDGRGWMNRCPHVGRRLRQQHLTGYEHPYTMEETHTSVQQLRDPQRVAGGSDDQFVVALAGGAAMNPNDSVFQRALSNMLREIFHGPPGNEAFVLNPGDPGLLGQLESVSAAAASNRPMPGKTTIAA